MLLVANLANTKWCNKFWKMTVTLAYGYSSCALDESSLSIGRVKEHWINCALKSTLTFSANMQCLPTFWLSHAGYPSSVSLSFPVVNFSPNEWPISRVLSSTDHLQLHLEYYCLRPGIDVYLERLPDCVCGDNADSKLQPQLSSMHTCWLCHGQDGTNNSQNRILAIIGNKECRYNRRRL